MMGWSHQRQRGDTLVEVLLATVILSMVVAGAIAMMNRGHSMARDSLERTQVTALMVEQAEMLQYIRDAYADASSAAERNSYPASLWESELMARTGDVDDACESSSEAFYIGKSIDGSGNASIDVGDFASDTINEASSQFVQTHAKPNEGLWIEAERPSASPSGVDYIDFHIKACWRANGSAPKQQAKTIVRLYVPEAVVVTPPPPPPAGCSELPKDILLVLDVSISMREPWQTGVRMDKLKEFSRVFVTDVDVSPSGKHVGIIEFDSEARTTIGLSSNEPALVNAVNRLSIAPTGGTNYTVALRRADTVFDNGRSNADKTVIFISDGDPWQDTGGIMPARNALIADGVRIFTIGLAEDLSGRAIDRMAGNGGRFVSAENESALQQVLAEIANETCD